jgi:transposase
MWVGMPTSSPPSPPLVLPRKVRKVVERWSRSAKLPHRIVVRAKIVALACEGCSNAGIARLLAITEQTARKWRERMRHLGHVKALNDLPRSGRPSQVPVAVRCEVIRLACERPDGPAHGKRAKRLAFEQVWTFRSLRDRVAKETKVSLSLSEVGRILHCEGLRPHRVRMWLHSSDPDFAGKVCQICTLYTSPPPGAIVLCVDEKPGMQSLEYLYPTHYARVGQEVRREFEYKRHGTSTLIAAFDVRTGEVFARCRRRTAKGLLAFMEALAQYYPSSTIYVVWDNLNIHKGTRWQDFNARHGHRFHFVYTPKHASWVNQIEVWFSILQRRVLKHASFATRDALKRAVLAFVRHWNRHEAHPFRWTFRGFRTKVATNLAA